MTKNSVLVTGGAGYIGSHAVKALHKQGIPVVVWTPGFEDIDLIVETAWRWRAAHPQGYRKATA